MKAESKNQNDRYRDIIDLPHPTSARHPRMPKADRAAQFAPFSALTGYDDAVGEAARLTEGRVVLDENAKEILDLKQKILTEMIDSQPKISVTHFVADQKKSGGKYQTYVGQLYAIDDYEKSLLFLDGTVIFLKNVISIDGSLFDSMFL